MKRIKTLLAVAVAAAGLAGTAEAIAQEKHGFRGHHGGRYYGGHHPHRWHGHLGFYIGAPLFFGYWGDPWYWGGPRVVYREVVREPEVVHEGVLAPSTELPRGEGAPTQGPLYMNYCESARAYFPKVTQCPEGWKFISPTQ